MPCTCLEEMDAKLAEHNTRLCVTFGFPRDGRPGFTLPTLQVEKIETRKRGKAVLALPSFCPFCGAPYAPPEARAPAAADARTPNSLAPACSAGAGETAGSKSDPGTTALAPENPHDPFDTAEQAAAQRPQRPQDQSH